MYQTNLYGEILRDSSLYINPFLHDTRLVLDYLDQTEYDKIHITRLSKRITDKSQGYKKLSNDKIHLILEYLKKQNQLQKIVNGTVYTCPECGYLIEKITCKSCGSQEIHEVRKIIHQKCGHIDTLDKFIECDNFTCKKCGIDIDYTKGGGIDGDYRFCDSTIECMKCGKAVKKPQDPSKLIKCTKCENTFKITQLKIVDLSIYQRDKTSNFT